MNESAITSGYDPVAWQRLLQRGRATGVVTQEEICEVLALDADALDAEIEIVRTRLACRTDHAGRVGRHRAA